MNIPALAVDRTFEIEVESRKGPCHRTTFAEDSSHLKLATAFDSKNITFTNVESDGSEVPASVLFPNDPKRRVEVWWSNPVGSNIHLIVIGGQSTWTGPGGTRLGQTLEQVEKLNHKPFKLKGFDKDHIVTVSDRDGGALRPQVRP